MAVRTANDETLPATFDEAAKLGRMVWAGAFVNGMTRRPEEWADRLATAKRVLKSLDCQGYNAIGIDGVILALLKLRGGE